MQSVMHGRPPATAGLAPSVIWRKTSSSRPLGARARQRLRRLVGEDAARGDDDRAIADRVDLFEDVGRDHDDLVLRHRADQRAHLVLLVRIEAVGRLVEDQHLRVVQQRLRQADAALEALRQRLDDLLEHARQAEARDDVVEPRAAPLAGQAAHVGDEFEEGAHRHFAVARRAFGQVAHAGLGRERLGLARRGRRRARCRRSARGSR